MPKVKTKPLTLWAIRKPTGDIITWAFSSRRERAIKTFVEAAAGNNLATRRPISALWRDYRRRGWAAIRVTIKEARP